MICRYYPGYTLEACRNLTFAQIRALMEGIRREPFTYVLMVEPKKT